MQLMYTAAHIVVVMLPCALLLLLLLLMARRLCSLVCKMLSPAPQIAFAQHQSSLAKMDGVYDKCTGVKKMDWSDGLKGKLGPGLYIL